MRRRACTAATAAAMAAAAAAAGCGTPSADLFVVERDGRLPGAELTLKVGDGGTVTCDGRERSISSAQLLEAREIEEELQPLLEEGGALPSRPGSQLTYRVIGERGTLRFADTSRGQPPVLGRLQRLTRSIARDACGRPR